MVWNFWMVASSDADLGILWKAEIQWLFIGSKISDLRTSPCESYGQFRIRDTDFGNLLKIQWEFADFHYCPPRRVIPSPKGWGGPRRALSNFQAIEGFCYTIKNCCNCVWGGGRISMINSPPWPIFGLSKRCDGGREFHQNWTSASKVMAILNLDEKTPPPFLKKPPPPPKGGGAFSKKPNFPQFQWSDH